MRLFSKDHLWVYQTDNTAKIGITDYAQKKLKAILFVNLPDVGDRVTSGVRLGDIESIKTVSDLISPVTGTVVHINEDLIDDPSVVNEDPYESWFIEVEVESLPDDLMDEEAYKKHV